jgi:N-terminal acetyltransferase B complex non-catalytic subunit
VLDATFCDVALQQGSELSEAVHSHCLENIAKTRELFKRTAEQDGGNDRSAPLALLELEKRSRSYKLRTGPSKLFTYSSVPEFEFSYSADQTTMVDQMESYFSLIGNKACCFEDLRPYLLLEEAELVPWTSFLESVPLSFVSIISGENLQNHLMIHCRQRCLTSDGR